MSYLHLRHLKIRDLRRQCLGILNYFRRFASFLLNFVAIFVL